MVKLSLPLTFNLRRDPLSWLVSYGFLAIFYGALMNRLASSAKGRKCGNPAEESGRDGCVKGARVRRSTGPKKWRNIEMSTSMRRGPAKMCWFISLALAPWPGEMCNETEMVQRQRNWEVRMTKRLKITAVGLSGLLLLNLIALVLNLSQSSKAAVGGMKYEDLMRDADFIRAVKSIAQECTVNVDLAKLKC
jgi:hypothetical protein